ncbi:MAG TPA: hypothetical protein PLL30_04450 [Candidatus Krumholzibacteria bacterium]|nr:hypothetical protein [Candidatus Krumholzibacteria bacterium]HPD71020.1 hypothetical protein [Candidatus Krumholzibacteria bacterium]HRY39280.1 hypothetical protein [Candidatus Krumholzibacteria bacterium]
MTEGDPLRDALDGLPREIPPRRDLWPLIAARLNEQDPASPAVAAWRQRLGRKIVPVAGLLAAASLAVVMIAREGRQPGSVHQPLDLTSLEQDYDLVRTDVLGVLATTCGQRPSAGCDGLRSGLDELDSSATELRRALSEAPAGSPESRWLAVQFQRTLEQARGLAGHATRL